MMQMIQRKGDLQDELEAAVKQYPATRIFVHPGSEYAPISVPVEEVPWCYKGVFYVELDTGRNGMI